MVCRSGGSEDIRRTESKSCKWLSEDLWPCGSESWTDSLNKANRRTSFCIQSRNCNRCWKTSVGSYVIPVWKIYDNWVFQRDNYRWEWLCKRDTSFQSSGTVGRSEQFSMAFRLPYECKLTDELLADIFYQHGRVCRTTDRLYRCFERTGACDRGNLCRSFQCRRWRKWIHGTYTEQSVWMDMSWMGL